MALCSCLYVDHLCVVDDTALVQKTVPRTFRRSLMKNKKEYTGKTMMAIFLLLYFDKRP